MFLKLPPLRAADLIIGEKKSYTVPSHVHAGLFVYEGIGACGKVTGFVVSLALGLDELG